MMHFEKFLLFINLYEWGRTNMETKTIDHDLSQCLHNVSNYSFIAHINIINLVVLLLFKSTWYSCNNMDMWFSFALCVCICSYIITLIQFAFTKPERSGWSWQFFCVWSYHRALSTFFSEWTVLLIVSKTNVYSYLCWKGAKVQPCHDVNGSPRR